MNAVGGDRVVLPQHSGSTHQQRNDLSGRKPELADHVFAEGDQDQRVDPGVDQGPQPGLVDDSELWRQR